MIDTPVQCHAVVDNLDAVVQFHVSLSLAAGALQGIFVAHFAGRIQEGMLLIIIQVPTRFISKDFSGMDK
jgi:hypothetical protein